MIGWCKYPFIRLLIPFALGIWSAFSFNDVIFTESGVLFLLIVLLIILLSSIISSIYIKNYRYQWIFAVLLNIFLFLLGYSNVIIKKYKLKLNDISNNTAELYYARLYECPVEKDNSVKVSLELIGLENNNRNFRKINSNIITYFEKSSESLKLKYGDCIAFSTNPKEVAEPPNPEQFDYKSYLYKKGITYQVYLKSDDWLNLRLNISNPIYRFSYWIRDFLLETMQQLGIQGNEYAVASAILLGYDDILPLDLRQKYVAAGAMHILCVSGLHVGVVFMVFSYMLVFLNDRKKAAPSRILCK